MVKPAQRAQHGNERDNNAQWGQAEWPAYRFTLDLLQRQNANTNVVVFSSGIPPRGILKSAHPDGSFQLTVPVLRTGSTLRVVLQEGQARVH